MPRSIVPQLLVASLLFVSGCNSKPAAAPAAPAAARPQVSLTSVIGGVAATEFEVNVPRDLVASDLNDWGEARMDEMLDPEVTDESLRQALSGLLDESAIDRLFRRRFALRDTTHLRDAVWARMVVESLIKPNDSDLVRVARVFEFVQQTVLPRLSNEAWPPFGPFELAMHGRGTAQDRAWVLATLLRQLRLPVVLLELPALAVGGSNTDAFLTGVLIDGELYLLDTQLGLSVPGPNDSVADVLPRLPATLKEALADDGLLRKLDRSPEQKWSVTAERLKQATVRIIGDSSAWSRRMEALQNGLAGGESAAVVFEPLTTTGTLEGTREQLVAALAGTIPAERITVWAWPEQQREAREALSAEQQKQVETIEDAWRVPQPMDVVPKPKGLPELSFGAGWGMHRQARALQLSGRTSEAIPLMLRLQLWGRLPPMVQELEQLPSARDDQFNPSAPGEPRPAGTDQLAPTLLEQLASMLPADVRARHVRAAEEARFWRGMCQVQKGAEELANENFETYLREYRTGLFLASARFQSAIALARIGEHRRAIAFLKLLSPGDPHEEAAQYLIRRWTPRAEAAKAK